jgi:pyruvate/2-oxoglutarate dehydrogenase complex dihydrolipoamide dehydrogenase (E3) component|eukprot:COSAG06_NODE_6530_length_2893_cov_1.152827_1_plen_451_part_00
MADDGSSHGAAASTWAPLAERARALEQLGQRSAALAREREASEREHVEMAPLDDDNARLLDQVHPHSWAPPTPAPLYNMVVVGAGAGGLVTAAQSAKRGAKVALIERGMMGGDCLNVGCVPSKALLACAKRMSAVRSAAEFGVHGASSPTLDFGEVMARMRRIRADIAEADSVQRFTGPDLGVDIFFGDAAFASRSCVTVGGHELNFQKACIATGGRAAVPPIPGLAGVPYRTNATVFNLTALPARLAIIGAGPIGCELAQAFALFGSEVHVYDLAPVPLAREDPDAAAIVIAALEKDGVTFHCSSDLASVASVGSPSSSSLRVQVELSFRSSGGPEKFDEILVCAGRSPNVEGMGLDAAGVELTKEGRVAINDSLQTTNPSVYAVGDVCMSTQFTHVAGESAQLVVRNALCADKRSWSELAIPWATYTHPGTLCSPPLVSAHLQRGRLD